MGKPKRRTEPEILADWRYLREQDDEELSDADRADLFEREARLFDEALSLPAVPNEMAIWAIGWAQLYLRELAVRVRGDR